MRSVKIDTDPVLAGGSSNGVGLADRPARSSDRSPVIVKAVLRQMAGRCGSQPSGLAY
jgi:hypothetical protein